VTDRCCLAKQSWWLSAVLVVSLSAVVWAQGAKKVTIRDTGVIAVSDDQGKLATLEVNVHGPEWQYASQADATAQVQRGEDGTRTFTGRLPIPNTTGGALTFREEVRPGEQSLRVTYELGFSQPMTTNGLQISLLLPADRVGGQTLSVRTGEAAAVPQRIILPRVLDPAKWQLGTMEGDKVSIGAEEEGGLTLTVGKTVDLVLHDLR
jgi:hypothetical protein